jgi:hypothetical protein
MMIPALARRRPSPLLRGLAAIALLLVVTLPWWITLKAPLILLDDPGYITENPDVMSGLTGHSLAAAFHSTRAAFYLPVTWLSLALDVTLFHGHTWGFHITNVILHIANAILLMFFLWRATGSLGRSLLVAALFAMHPLRVESVAWVTERKDVLATFFGLLAMLSYQRFVRSRRWPPRVAWYGAVCALFSLSLLSKPMLVPLPFLLLLLDIWPFRRWAPGLGRPRLVKLLLEKLPLLALSATIVVVNLRIQSAYHAIGGEPLGRRLGNAILSYGLYLRDQFYFQDLAVFYPYHAPPPDQVLLAAVVLLAISAAAVAYRWKSPGRGAAILLGWLWFIGMLVPNIGLVQSGSQMRADRFTYFPSIGIFVMLAWCWPRAWLRARPKMAALTGAGCVLVVTIYTTIRIFLWNDPLQLYLDTLAHTGANPTMEYVMGRALQYAGAYPPAEEHYKQAIALQRGFADAHDALGATYVLQHRLREAEREFSIAHALAPENTYYALHLEATRAELRRLATQPGIN